MLSASEWQALHPEDDLDDQIWDIVVRGDEQEVYRIPGGTTDPGLGIAEFLEYKQEVESKRRAIKAEFASAAREQCSLREVLLDRYDKLFVLITQRKERDEARVSKHLTDEDKLAKARMQETEYKEKLLKEISELEKDLERTSQQYDDAQTYLADFLRHNAKMLHAAEKAEALDTEQRRKVLRKQAHDQILEAFQGVASTDTSLGMFKLMREQRDAFSSAEELRDELKQLREYEETTDDLVDRLRIKVESVDLLEESQVQMIEGQVTKQQKLGHKIKGLQLVVQQNNDDLQTIVDKVQVDISDKLDHILSKKRLACICCAVSFILIVLLGAAFVYVIDQNTGADV